jgi:hypothetical protein
MNDILQQAILDVNKLKEIGMKAAQKKLIEKYSKDLKKIYIKEAEELAGDNFDDLLDSESKDELDSGQDPGSGLENPDMNDSGSQGGDQLVNNAEPGSSGNMGLEPQGQDPVLDNLPNSDTPDTEVELFIVTKNNDDGDDLSSLESETDQLEQGMSMGDPNSDLTDELDSSTDLDMDLDDLDVNEDELFDSLHKDLKINDEVLFEYIQKSFDNDEKFKKLSSQIEKLSETVDFLKDKLTESNKNLKQLKEQNIRLYFKNKANSDDSLSEHQKRNIVEALNKADTMEQAKLIFESAKGAKSKNVNTNSLILEESSITKKYARNSKKEQILEKKEEILPKIAQRLYEKWGI